MKQEHLAVLSFDVLVQDASFVHNSVVRLDKSSVDFVWQKLHHRLSSSNYCKEVDKFRATALAM